MENIADLLKFVDDFNEIREKEEMKLPYHINLIDELHAGENAHSRILEKLLKQQEPTTRKHEILESFVRYIIGKYGNDTNDFSKIKIENPIITQEKQRIDLWIRDDDYAIVLENKVAWAPDQQNQLESYINVTKKYGFEEEQIYVLYLPPTYNKEPDKQTWGNYYEHEIRNRRYLKLSFKDDILPWLNDFVLPNIRLRDNLLSSAIEQYIDHLEGKFSLRTINNNMNMELKNFIRKELGLNESHNENNEILSKKKNELLDVISQIDSLIEEEENNKKNENFRNNKVKWEECNKQWQSELSKIDFGEPYTYNSEEKIYTGIISKKNNIKFRIVIALWWGTEEPDKPLFYGISPLDERESLNPYISKSFASIEGYEKDNKWYLWNWTTFEKAWDDLYKLIKAVKTLR